MTINKITEVTIFESPDGGRTVYARNPGSKNRELHSRDPALEKELADLRQQKRWQFILAARETNPAINELCEQAEILYELYKSSK
jgi:hypothetical protein